MSAKSDILARFQGVTTPDLLYLPNLTLWYSWHRKQGTLPAEWKGWSLPEICRDLGAPVWTTARVYRQDNGGVDIERDERSDERVIAYRLASGTLVERWKLGPDGDWWQTEYPVKSRSDLEILLEIVQARSYVYDPHVYETRQAEIGDDGVAALELPRRPFSQVFLEWLGWSEGLMLLFDAGPLIDEILAELELKLRALVVRAAAGPGEIFVSPDNLDGQFISPPFFQQYLTASYRHSAETLHQGGKVLLVDTGGPIRRLLAPLAQTGADGVQGVSGPPQCDATLAEARSLTGPGFTLWGGIPQDALLADFPHAEFEAIVRQAALEANEDPRMILGVADRVSVDSDLDRLRRIPALLDQALS